MTLEFTVKAELVFPFLGSSKEECEFSSSRYSSGEEQVDDNSPWLEGTESREVVLDRG